MDYETFFAGAVSMFFLIGVVYMFGFVSFHKRDGTAVKSKANGGKVRDSIRLN